MQLQIKRVKVTDPHSDHHDAIVDVIIDNGIITSIKAGKGAKSAILQDGVEVWSSKQMPEISCGWVDMFADYREPGYEHKETLEAGMRTAARGGYTDVALVPNTLPVVSNKSAVQYILRQTKGNVVSVHPMGAATQQAEGKDLAEMMDMRHHGAVAFGDGWKPIQNAGLLLKALEYVKAFDGTILQIPTDASLAAGGLMNESEVSTALGMAGVPAIAETLAVYRDIELARYTQSKLHLTGISTAKSVALIKKAKAEGVQVTCSVAPYHLFFTEEALRTYDSKYKVAPPLRSEQDRKALIAGIADGTIDSIASHHKPQEWDAKTKEFEYAADGMALQELCWNVALQASQPKVSTERLIDALTTRPRAILGLPEQKIAKGMPASITIYDRDAESIYNADDRATSGMNIPFSTGTVLKGRVVGIINNNQLHIN